MSELKRFLVLFVAFVAFLLAAYIQGRGEWRGPHSLRKSIHPKGARSVCRILTRQARSRMRIAGQPGLQKPPSPGLTGGLPRVVAREPFPDLLPATSGRIDDGNAKCCTAVIALHFFRSLR
jgi:hypothetical protein